MKNQRKHLLLSVAVAMAALLVGSARAELTAVAFDTTRFWTSGSGTGVYGWQFTARLDIQVLSLGLYDNPSPYDGGFPGDGFIDPHAIGIWDVSSPSSLLLSSLIPAGTAAPLVNGFRYVNTSPVSLLAGHDYVIAAAYQGEDSTVGDFNNPEFVLTISPEIEFGGYRFSGGSSALDFPEGLDPDHLYAFGPNFTYIAAVPEPSTLPFCVLGAAVLLASTLRRKSTR